MVVCDIMMILEGDFVVTPVHKALRQCYDITVWRAIVGLEKEVSIH